MAAPELGAKQICPTCQAKFYDLHRRPAHCPKCESEFDPDEALKSRRVRTRATPDYEKDEAAAEAAAPAPDDAEAPEDDAEAEEAAPEIDEAIEAEPLTDDDEIESADIAPAAPADDLGVGFEEEVEEDADDEAAPFLEVDDEEDLGEETIDGLPGADDET